MNKNIMKNAFKCLGFGVVWAVILFVIALIITNFKDYTLIDVLFVEGIIFSMIGFFSSIEGSPLGLSMQGLGQSNAQYISNANLEVSRMEKERLNNIKSTITIGLSTVSIVIGGVLVVILSFIL